MTGEVLSMMVGLVLGAALVAAVLQRRLRRERAAALALAELALAARLDEAGAALATLADLRANLSGLRHDLRSILSPALLVADRLINHEEPGVRRAGEVMIRTVERAVTRLTETRPDQDAAKSVQL